MPKIGTVPHGGRFVVAAAWVAAGLVHVLLSFHVDVGAGGVWLARLLAASALVGATALVVTARTGLLAAAIATSAAPARSVTYRNRPPSTRTRWIGPSNCCRKHSAR